MKFQCKRDKLKNAVARVEKVVSKQTTLPILSNILIKTEKGQLLLMATNLELAVKIKVSAKIDQEGSTTIPPRILSGFLNNIKDEVISCELLDGKFYIKSENHSIQIKTLSTKDFPIIPEIPEEPFLRIKATNLIKAISGVNISVARNDTRQELNGIYIDFKKEEIIMASTDSFRLSEVRVPIIKKSTNSKYFDYIENNGNIIVPIGFINEIQQLSGDEEVGLFVNENQIFLDGNYIQIVSQLVDGHYPDYKQIIPTDCDNQIYLDKDDLLEAVKIASLVTNSQNGEIKLSKNKNDKFITVTAQSVDLGENVSTVNILKNSEAEFEIFFNHRYLIEGLSCPLFVSDKIKMEFKEGKSPVLFKGVDDNFKEFSEFLYMVMPIIKE